MTLVFNKQIKAVAMTNISSDPSVEIPSAEYESIADDLLKQMQYLNAGMQKDQLEIERLKAENRIVLSRLKAMW